MKRSTKIGLGIVAGAGVIGGGLGLRLRSRRAEKAGGAPQPGRDGQSPPEAPATLPAGVVPPRPFLDTPFAEGVANPVWPARTQHPRGDVLSYRDDNGDYQGNWARRFGAPRSSGERRHAGVDLFANDGDVVVALADGVVVGLQSFHLGSWGLLVDHGPFVMLYGEVTKGSWAEFGVQKGSEVRAGEPIARVACCVSRP
ncbi:MAG: peptidoglycan DD-metalloendopeptidase family protein [Nannocystales bacterium]